MYYAATSLPYYSFSLSWLFGTTQKVVLFLCCVNYRQKRLQDSGVVRWHCHSALFLSVSSVPLLVFSIAGNYMAYASSLLHSLILLLLFFCHTAALASTVAPMLVEPLPLTPPTLFLSDIHGCSYDFVLQILVSRDHSPTYLEEVTEMSVFSFCVHESKGGKSKRERESARCNTTYER